MRLTHPDIEIEYPESDGKPLGETDLHRYWIVRLIDMLAYRYRGQRIYVSGDLLVYYVRGNVKKFVVPDVFAVKDCDPGFRRVFKIWEEGRVPNAIVEVTSRRTKREDRKSKPVIYARLRVPEYFLYDPTGDYLNPQLQGFRLAGADYCPIEPDATGALVCEQLNLLLRLEESRLALFDRTTGERLLTEGEAGEAAQQALAVERAAREAEQRARESAEAEVERLRKLLEQTGNHHDSTR
ncbi:MAG TPA: Uma2 family endonuclease [Planctomycetaceae bacterium]|nr:Uma2 family endonuclease [Planctomycetaceae bacterium]